MYKYCIALPVRVVFAAMRLLERPTWVSVLVFMHAVLTALEKFLLCVWFESPIIIPWMFYYTAATVIRKDIALPLQNVNDKWGRELIYNMLFYIT